MSQRVTTSPPISIPHNAHNASNVVNVAPAIHFSRSGDSHLSHHKHYFILTILGKHSDICWWMRMWKLLSTLRNMRYNCWAFETWCSLHWTSTLISECSASSFDSSRGLKHWSMLLTQWWKLMLGTVPVRWEVVKVNEVKSSQFAFNSSECVGCQIVHKSILGNYPWHTATHYWNSVFPFNIEVWA